MILSWGSDIFCQNVNLNDIYGPINDQIQVVQVLSKIDLVRKKETSHYTWRIFLQDPCGYINVITRVNFIKKKKKLQFRFN